MSRKRTFVDSCVLMAAFRGEEDISRKAMEILDDPEREFVVSDYLRLEVLPKPTFNYRREEVEFMEAFLGVAPNFVTSASITGLAIEIASTYDVQPMDSLHASIAIHAHVDEFVTLEKDTKPLFRIKDLTVRSLRNP